MKLLPLTVAACKGSDFVSTRISRITGSIFSPSDLKLSPSHVAILCEMNGSYLWVESTTMCNHPCLIKKVKCDGCQAHWPDYRINDYIKNGGKVDLYKPTKINELDENDSKKLTHYLINEFVEPGVGYDMGGALISGTRVYKKSWVAPWADLHSVFCSELVAKMCMRFGFLPLDNPAIYNPGELIRSLLEIGTMELLKSNVQPSEIS